MDANHTVQATFAPAKSSAADVPGNHPNVEAIAALASRGNILGYDSTHYGPDDGVQRAQMAVLIARATPNGPGTPTNGTLVPPGCTVAGSWDCEDWGTTFTDRGGVPASLWRAAGTLQHYNVAFGYTAQDCANQGRAFPCYGPTDPVSYAQTLAFISRAMVAKGFWVAQPNAPLPGGNVPGVLATPLRTFAYYTGGVPTAPTDWNAGARRAAGSPVPSGPPWIATGAPTATCPPAGRPSGPCRNRVLFGCGGHSSPPQLHTLGLQGMRPTTLAAPLAAHPTQPYNRAHWREGNIGDRTIRGGPKRGGETARQEGTMRAAVFREVGRRMQIEDVTLADPKPGEALVKIIGTGVCHSDYHVIKGEWASPLPIVLGHEASGIVEAVGAGVTQAQPGDHVVLSFAPNCGQCAYCVAGHPHLCSAYLKIPPGGLLDGTSRLSIGNETIYMFGKMASFAEYSVVAGASLIPIRKDAPLAKAALIGCAVMTGVGAALNTAKIEAGTTVMVVGCGGVGLNCIQGARLASASRIIAVDVADDKLEFARMFGATDVVNSRREDPVAVARELTNGMGVDYALEAIGLKVTIEQCYHAIRRGGTAVVVGMAPDGVEAAIPARAIAGTEKTLRGSFYGSTRPLIDMPRLIDFYMDGRLLLDELVTRTYPLEEINEAYNDLGEGGVGRGLLLPHGEVA